MWQNAVQETQKRPDMGVNSLNRWVMETGQISVFQERSFRLPNNLALETGAIIVLKERSFRLTNSRALEAGEIIVLQ